jgi:hypothetical protein
MGKGVFYGNFSCHWPLVDHCSGGDVNGGIIQHFSLVSVFALIQRSEKSNEA